MNDTTTYFMLVSFFCIAICIYSFSNMTHNSFEIKNFDMKRTMQQMHCFEQDMQHTVPPAISNLNIYIQKVVICVLFCIHIIYYFYKLKYIYVIINNYWILFYIIKSLNHNCYKIYNI